MNQDGEQLVSPEMTMLRNNKLSGYNYRYRRKFDWDENYELYRDKVIVNRLTQRQSVNMPLMKSSIRTLLKDVDDMPLLYFENLDNDKEAELFKNEYWKKTVEHNNMELQDIVDKRQVFLYGRSVDQWQVIDGWVKQTVQDPYDILISRYVDPYNIHSSRFLIHTNIFVPLSTLRLNKDYDQQAVKDMEDYYATQQGLIRSSENQRLFIEKNQRLADMGVQDIYNPILGETYIMLTLHFVWKESEIDANGDIQDLEPQIYMYTEADNMRILMKKPLEAVMGVTSDHYWRTHFPYTSWADDMERQDFWSDGVADIIRTPNKVLNSWFSQLVENRTLKNFSMNIYNSNLEGFTPQSWEPKPWGWYGVPVPPNTDLKAIYQPMPVGDLSDSLEEMNFITSMIQEASGATATQQGGNTPTQVTLGEVQLMLGEAKQRIKGMSKFYTKAWEDRGMMFLKLVEAAHGQLEDCTIYKKGLNSSAIFKREISPKDWMTPSGYGVKVWSQDEKTAMDTDALNKLNAVKANMPGNMKLQEIYDRKLLEFADLKPDEVNDVMKEEQDMQQNQQKAPPKEMIDINYKDAPPDIQAQMEEAAGFKPSAMHNLGGQPTPPDAPGGAQPMPSGQPQGGQPAGGTPNVPPTIQPNGNGMQQAAAQPAA